MAANADHRHQKETPASRETPEPSAGSNLHSASATELELLRLAEDFLASNDRLDALVMRDDLSDSELLTLHNQWEHTCSRAATLLAFTREGQRAKARMLIAALEVIVPRKTERQLHEKLAASLARDLIDQRS